MQANTVEEAPCLSCQSAAACSEGTIRRRLEGWAAAGVGEQVHTLTLAAYDRMIGPDLDDLAVDGGITGAPGGGEVAGRAPVDRGKQGLKRSVITDRRGSPLPLVTAGANRHDAPLLASTLAGLDKLDGLPDDVTVHLDRGYDGGPTRALLDALGVDGAIARKGVPAPIPAGSRRVVERTHRRMNGFGKLRRCTETRQSVVDFYLLLAGELVEGTTRQVALDENDSSSPSCSTCSTPSTSAVGTPTARACAMMCASSVNHGTG